MKKKWRAAGEHEVTKKSLLAPQTCQNRRLWTAFAVLVFEVFRGSGSQCLYLFCTNVLMMVKSPTAGTRSVEEENDHHGVYFRVFLLSMNNTRDLTASVLEIRGNIEIKHHHAHLLGRTWPLTMWGPHEGVSWYRKIRFLRSIQGAQWVFFRIEKFETSTFIKACKSLTVLWPLPPSSTGRRGLNPTFDFDRRRRKTDVRD